ncbi:uncharacterized protein LOC111345947 isoform X1 [Stylophora pistillata]|uniref:uncharacterized protein LOC111345947 isoform X1 n=1 Tax=Stylophora pistillata TaxID=50429 RepID=UPI000C049617|nr:uncharacterized protein LOC111345947 isoform X1 [Stylophora pistillata]
MDTKGPKNSAKSSKQRTRLRCKISTEKAKVTSRIQQYNEQTQCDQVSNLQSTSTVSEVMKGNLPLEGSADPDWYSSILVDDNSEMVIQRNLTETKYKTTSTSARVLRGKISLAKKGIALCKSQMYCAATKFKAALTGSGYEECLNIEENAEIGDKDDNDYDDDRSDSRHR